MNTLRTFLDVQCENENNHKDGEEDVGADGVFLNFSPKEKLIYNLNIKEIDGRWF
jgi:hypothetical protein